MSFETGAEENAYDLGFKHGQEQGEYLVRSRVQEALMLDLMAPITGSTANAVYLTGAQMARQDALKKTLDIVRSKQWWNELHTLDQDVAQLCYLIESGVRGINTNISGGDLPTDSASSTLPIAQEEMKTFHCSKCPMTVKVLGDYADLYLRCPNCTSVLIKGEK